MSAVRSAIEASYAQRRQRRWSHAWDQWSYTDYFFDPDPAQMKMLEPLSDAGLGALAVALLEWQCFHFDTCEKAQAAQHYADAAWVGFLVPGSCTYVSLDHSDWAGPANGPLRASVLVVNDVLYDAAVDGQYALRACWAVQLARHCCESALSDSLDEWIARCIHRIGQLAPKAGPQVSDDPFIPTFAPAAQVSPRQLAVAGAFSLVSVKDDLASHRDSIIGQNEFLHPAPVGTRR